MAAIGRRAYPTTHNDCGAQVTPDSFRTPAPCCASSSGMTAGLGYLRWVVAGAADGTGLKALHSLCADGATIYVKICQEWGADHLGGFEGAVRLGELAEGVVTSARPHGAPSFVGWRNQPLPDPETGPNF